MDHHPADVSPAALRGSATGPLWVMLVASLLAPMLLFAVTSWVNHRDALAAAAQELTWTAEVAREQAGRVFDSQSQAEDRVNDLVRGMDAAAVGTAGKALHDAFAAIAARLPQLQGLLLADAGGHPLVSATLYPVPANAKVDETDYFQAVVAHGARQAFVTDLQVGGIDRQTLFGLARPWRGAGGAVQGVVDAAVSPAFFEDCYRSLAENGPGGAAGKQVALVRDDGRILASYPPSSAHGPQAVPAELLAALGAHPVRGVVESGPAPNRDAPARLLAFGKVENYPLYVVAGRDRAAIIAGWRRTMTHHLVLGIPASLALAAMTATALVRTGRERRALALARSEITRRERAEAALTRSQRLEAVGQMTGGVAHDFNNLLAVIVGSAELLQRRAGDPARVRRLAEQIIQATRRGGTITQQLLTFSRRQFLDPRIVDLNQHLREFQPVLARAAREGVAVRLDLAPRLHPVRLDLGHLEAALLNLVGNARDAMGGCGRVLLSTRNIALGATPGGADRPEAPPGDYVRISVADTGPGMDQDTAARAFEPYFTTKGVGSGTGLGLSQVYGFVKQAGGDACILAAPGRGTTVQLLLPRAAGAAQRRACLPTTRGGDAGRAGC